MGRSDEAELRELLTGPYGRIVRAVAVICDSHAAAEDAVHEAIARAWLRRDQIEHLDRWVVTVALNLARSRWRRLRRETVLSDGPAHVDADAATVEWLQVLRGLPPRQREVAVLHYVFDLDIAAIAATAGISPGAVKNALFHARRSLVAAVTEETTP